LQNQRGVSTTMTNKMPLQSDKKELLIPSLGIQKIYCYSKNAAPQCVHMLKLMNETVGTTSHE